MVIYLFQKGFNYSQDGPGNRLVIHLSGCNLSCPWCSNPEGIKQDKSKAVSVSTLAEEILSCIPMFFDGGGVTFTGGECSMQTEKLLELIQVLRKKGISVAIESNASLEGFKALACASDYIIADYKSPNREKLLKYTGAELLVIEENLINMCMLKNLHIRIPLIHGFNDSKEDLMGFVGFFERLGKTALPFDVEILPYHEYGKQKWESLGLNYVIENGFVTDKRVEAFEQTLKEHNIKVIRN